MAFLVLPKRLSKKIYRIEPISYYGGTTMGFRCQKNDGSFTTTTWKFYTAKCTRIQQSLGICSGISGAWVPAITVCNLRLF